MKKDILKIINNEFYNSMFFIKDKNSKEEIQCVNISNKLNDIFYDKKIQMVIQKTGLKESDSDFMHNVAGFMIDEIYYEYMILSQKDVEDVENFLLSYKIKLPIKQELRRKLCLMFLKQIRTVYKRNDFSEEQKQLLVDNFTNWLKQIEVIKNELLNVEIIKQYYNNNMNFLAIKYQKDKSGKYYLGLAGVFDDDGNFESVNHSDFDVIDNKENIDELCHKCMISLFRKYVEK